MPDLEHATRFVHLRQGGTSLALRLDPAQLPSVIHWGPDLGEIGEAELAGLAAALEMPTHDGAIYQHSWASILPSQTAGWIGRPGLIGTRAGGDWALTYTSVDHQVRDTDTGSVARSVAVDALAGVEVTTDIELDRTGLVRARAGVRNLGETPYEVTLLQPALPVPAEADELLDMAGRHAHERTPQRRAFTQGQHVREAWGGRPGHDSATVLCAGRTGHPLPQPACPRPHQPGRLGPRLRADVRPRRGPRHRLHQVGPQPRARRSRRRHRRSSGRP